MGLVARFLRWLWRRWGDYNDLIALLDLFDLKTGFFAIFGGIAMLFIAATNFAWSPQGVMLSGLVAAACVAIITIAVRFNFGERKVSGRGIEPAAGTTEFWSLRRLFAYLAPDLPLTAHRVVPGGGITTDVDERWKSVGDTVSKELSVGRLHAIGREIIGTKRLHAAPIPSDFWAAAKFTYWFLDDGPSVWDVGNGRSFAEVEVDAAEAMSIWAPEPWPDFKKWDKAREFRLYEAACLWANQEPRLPMEFRAKRRFEQLADAIRSKNLPVRRDDLREVIVDSYSLHERGVESKPNPNWVIKREDLINYASTNDRPPFLFPKERA